MKRILIAAILGIFSLPMTYAQNGPDKMIKAFPFAKSSEAAAPIAEMSSWGKSTWKSFFVLLDDDSLKTSASFALSAYINNSASAPASAQKAAEILNVGLSAVKSAYAKDLLLEYAGLLGNDVSVKTLSGFLKDPILGPRSARSLGTIRSDLAIAALEKAMTRAEEPMKLQIKAALDNARFILPALPVKKTITVAGKFISPSQVLLDFQEGMQKTKDPVGRRKLLHAMDGTIGFPALMAVAPYLDDPILKKQAASIMARNALQDKNLRGIAPRSALEKALPLISGTDSAYLVNALKAYLKALPYDNGWVSIFNGKDLTGWKGLVGNPITRSKMTAEELMKAEADANAKAGNDWVVDNGLLIFTGHGDNLCTVKKYGDFEMLVDWKITEKGDAGIYLRGSPQVQIWDTSRREVGAQVGSGGLYNNKNNISKPLSVADNAIGEWNTFHIIMKGDKVTVLLNGVKVTDNVVLENYWDRALPIFAKEQIELQAHGTYVAYRNIYLRELPADPQPIVLSDQEKKEGFDLLFDGTHLDRWTGNKRGYVVEDGTITTHPEHGGGGNLYTADEYDNFEYRFEFQLTPGANNGLGIRTPTSGDAAYVGMELQILDNEAPVYAKLNPYQYHGSVYGVIPSKRGFLKPTGEWNEQTVIAKGNKIKVILNGQVILDGDIKEASKDGTADHREHPGLLNAKGHIGFLGHGDVVRFRNIRVKRL